MNHKLTPLFDALEKFHVQERYSFHVPGHKGGAVFLEKGVRRFRDILAIDQTEVSGLDDLYAPTGVIREAQALLTDFYQTKQSYFLVNGSTVGNLVMVLASCEPGDLVLVQRNAHKSIFNALKLARVKAVFLEPEQHPETKMGVGLSFEIIQEAVSRYPEAKALILTYPNYYGQTMPIKKIFQFVKKAGIGILVDEAHGPHFKWGDPFPKSSLDYGADLVVHSAHKMLPAMTMGAFLHLNSNWVSEEKVLKILKMLQSSSPSYPIMATLDLSRAFIATLQKDKVTSLIGRLEAFKEELRENLGWRVSETEQGLADPLKVTIQIPGCSGFYVKEHLEGLGLFPEMADPFNVLLTFGLDEHPPYGEMFKALASLELKVGNERSTWSGRDSLEKISANPLDFGIGSSQSSKRVLINEAIGKRAGEDLIPYPPGIPILVEGEYITQSHIDEIFEWRKFQASFQGGMMEDHLVIIED